MIDWNDLDLKIKDEESDDDYKIRICKLKAVKGLYWDEVAQIINQTLGLNHTESKYRKEYSAYLKGVSDGEKEDDLTELSEYMQQKIELAKERIKVSDERNQTTAYVRQIAREETIKEIALECAKEMNNKKMLGGYDKTCTVKGDRSAILQLSDIHYGLIVDNYWNKYDTDIAKSKISQLRDKVINYCKFNNVSDLYVVNLGDSIAGRIHEVIKYQSRIDVITQTMEISEIIAEFLIDLSKYFNIHYYNCTDNHSRLEPNKANSLDLESLARIIPWYLKTRIGNQIEINDNKYGLDIVSFNCRGHNICGVHGDKDAPIKVVDSVSMMTREQYDMVLTAHLHHFSADEKNQILVISNPSILSTDDYAKNLRLTSKSAQNLIIVSDKEVMECLYRIVLE